MVFTLNTIVGFACSLGLDMGYNSTHHGEEEATTEAVVHIHKKDKKHIHQEAKESENHDKSHNHDEEKKPNKSKSGKGKCCTDKVIEFQELDKSLPASISIIYPVYFKAFVADYYDIILISHTDIVRDIKLFVRNHHPPIADIRVAIQSFQI